MPWIQQTVNKWLVKDREWDPSKKSRRVVTVSSHDSEQEADAQLERLRQQRETAKNASQSISHLSFEQYAALWLMHREKQIGAEGIAYATWVKDRKEMHNHIIPYAKREGWTIQGIRTRDVEDFANDRREAANTDATAKKSISVLKKSLTDATRAPFRLRDGNPGRGIEASRTPKSAHVAKARARAVPTEAEVQAVIAGLIERGERLKRQTWQWHMTAALVSLGAYESARPSEAAGLLWHHVNLTTGFATIGLHAAVHTDGRMVDAAPGRGAKTVDRMHQLSDTTAELLELAQTWRDSRQPDRVLPGTWSRHANPPDHPFPGRALDLAEVRKRIKLVDDRWKPYDFRHHYASRELTAGVPIGDVALAMGDRISTVETTYHHVAELGRQKQILAQQGDPMQDERARK